MRASGGVCSGGAHGLGVVVDEGWGSTVHREEILVVVQAEGLGVGRLDQIDGGPIGSLGGLVLRLAVRFGVQAHLGSSVAWSFEAPIGLG